MKKDIETLLDGYTSVVMEVDSVERKKREIIDSIIPPEVKQALAEVDEEFALVLSGLNEKMAMYESTIKTAVAEFGDTVRNDVFMAVYSKPRVTWNTEVLDKLSKTVPEVKMARKEGKPSGSIRRIK
jgi:hypothetical protein